MKKIPLSTIQKIYRAAISPSLANNESVVWWREMASEILHVIAAPTDATAGEIISWWHPDWSLINAHQLRLRRGCEKPHGRMLSSSTLSQVRPPRSEAADAGSVAALTQAVARFLPAHGSLCFHTSVRRRSRHRSHLEPLSEQPMTAP